MKYKIQTNMYQSSSYHVKEMMFVSACKKTVIKLSIYLAFAIGVLLIAVVPHFFYSKKQIPHHRYLRYPTDLKYILIWKEPTRHKGHFVRKETEFSTGQHLFIQQQCTHINCYITYDKNALKEDHYFDAVVFNIEDAKRLDVDKLNLTRCPEQLYIFRSMESAEHNPICDHDFDHFFNWTWTYKLDSDIPQPFFNIHNASDTIVGPMKDMKWIEHMDDTDRFSEKLKSKNKAVAWIVTKCKLKTQHQDFIKEFRNELRGYNYSLDVYGPCGQKKCPGGRVFKCFKMVEKSYYFQLVLEDSVAEDYVTESIVNAMTHLSLPIVYGNSHYRNFLPPGSYINAQTFDMKKLGALVDYLIKNKDMYRLFFDWKKHYYYTARQRTNVCDLCKKLNENYTAKTHEHFRRWWNPEYTDVCQRMSLMHMFNSEH